MTHVSALPHAAPVASASREAHPPIAFPPGAALVVSPTGRVLVERKPFPVPHLRGTTLRGRCLDEIGPPALGESLQRLWQSFRQDGALHVSEVGIGLEAHNPVVHYSLSLAAGPHPEFPDLCVVTVRDVRRHAHEVQDLLGTIESLREECTRWETATRTTAHDVRSSLSALVGFVQLSLQASRERPCEVAENLVRALQIGKRLLGVLKDWEESRQPRTRDTEQVTIAALGQHLFQALHAAYPQEVFTWHVESTDEVIRVPMTVAWNALWNVLTNAIKYRSPHRPLHIGLRAWSADATVQLEVRDSGRGIPSGEEETVFDCGHRGANTAGVEGNGLGLYSVRQYLASCGGRIWFAPCPDGALVRITLPLSPDGACHAEGAGQ